VLVRPDQDRLLADQGDQLCRGSMTAFLVTGDEQVQRDALETAHQHRGAGLRAGGRDVLAAGEMTFARHESGWYVVEVTNHTDQRDSRTSGSAAVYSWS